MKASRYMILLYATMLLVPLLLLVNAAAIVLAAMPMARVAEALAALGLAVYAIMGFIEAYGHGPQERNVLGQLTQSKPKQAAVERGRGERIMELELRRFNSKSKGLDEVPYRVRANRFTTVLDALISIKAKQDNSLSVRYSCRMGICGSCGMVVNGKPALACETCLFDVAKENRVEVEPMQAHPLLKDLVTDFDDFFEKHRSVEPGLYRKDTKEQNKAASVYKQSKEERDAYLPYSYCIMCGLCQDACPVVNSNPKFIGPQALSQVYRYRRDSRDQMGEKRLNIIDNLDSVWGCEFAGACSEVCPKGVDPAAAIQALKFDIFREYLPGKKKDD